MEHTKEEYDELVGMVMQLKESENKLVLMLANSSTGDSDVHAEDKTQGNVAHNNERNIDDGCSEVHSVNDITLTKTNNDSSVGNNTLKKVTNEENEQINKTIFIAKSEETQSQRDHNKSNENRENEDLDGSGVEIREIESILGPEFHVKEENDDHLNNVLRKNILSCVEKIALIEEMKTKSKDTVTNEDQVSVCGYATSVHFCCEHTFLTACKYIIT